VLGQVKVDEKSNEITAITQAIDWRTHYSQWGKRRTVGMVAVDP
jgi:hypothetical protein